MSLSASKHIGREVTRNCCKIFNGFCPYALRLTLDAERADERKLARLRRRLATRERALTGGCVPVEQVSLRLNSALSHHLIERIACLGRQFSYFFRFRANISIDCEIRSFEFVQRS